MRRRSAFCCVGTQYGGPLKPHNVDASGAQPQRALSHLVEWMLVTYSEIEMDVVETRKVGQNLRELLMALGVRELDLAHVELPNAHDVVAWVNYGGRFALRLREDNVDEVRRSGDGLNLLEIVHDHGCTALAWRPWTGRWTATRRPHRMPSEEYVPTLHRQCLLSGWVGGVPK